jgi:hypothetical protein
MARYLSFGIDHPLVTLPHFVILTKEGSLVLPKPCGSRECIGFRDGVGCQSTSDPSLRLRMTTVGMGGAGWDESLKTAYVRGSSVVFPGDAW